MLVRGQCQDGVLPILAFLLTDYIFRNYILFLIVL